MKFRIWDIENKQFIPHERLKYFLIDSQDGEVFKLDEPDPGYDQADQYGQFYGLCYTAMESTGLFDKNDTEIYEGDYLLYVPHSGAGAHIPVESVTDFLLYIGRISMKGWVPAFDIKNSVIDGNIYEGFKTIENKNIVLTEKDIPYRTLTR